MQALRRKLQKHKTTRRLVSHESCNQADDELEDDLRDDLAWQQRLVRSLLDYSAAVATAVGALTQAHEALLDGGIDDIKCGPVVRALLKSLRGASKNTGDAVAAIHALRSFDQSLAGHEEDLREADRAAAEHKRYDEKVREMADKENSQAQTQGRAKMERNREKLQRSSIGAETAHKRALGALQHCAARRESLCDLANEVIRASAHALCGITGGDPIASTVARAGESFNPFDEDLAQSPKCASSSYALVCQSAQKPAIEPRQFHEACDYGSRCIGNDTLAGSRTEMAHNPFGEDLSPECTGGQGSGSNNPFESKCTAQLARADEHVRPECTSGLDVDDINPFSDMTKVAVAVEAGRSKETAPMCAAGASSNIKSPLLEDCHAQPTSGNPFDDDAHEACTRDSGGSFNPFDEEVDGG